MKINSGAWAPEFGEKKDRLFNRPLIPCTVAFAGGILAAYPLSPLNNNLYLPIAIAVSLCLLISLSRRSKTRAWLLVIAFFLTGALLAPEEDLPSPLRSLAEKGQKATILGVVLEPSASPLPHMARVEVLAQGLVFENTLHPLNEKILLTVYKNALPFSPGRKIRFTGRLRTFKNFRNPGRYDYESAMTLRGFTCAAAVSDGRTILPMGSAKLPFFRAMIEQLQAPVRSFIRETLNHQNGALFRAFILGERQELDRNLRENFNRSGLGHVLAVSGLHIGLVAWAAFSIFKWGLSRSYCLLLLTDVRKWSAFLTCFPVVGYTLLAGCRVSSERAMIMVLAYLLSLILGREKDVWSTLSLAGIIILFLDPGALFTPSFQLSFVAVIGILWLSPSILKHLGLGIEAQSESLTHMRSVMNYVAGLAAVSISAVYFLLPITTYYFHRIALVSIPANLTTIPILGLWVLPLGLLSILLLPFSIQLATPLLHASALGIHIMTEVVQFWAGLPWASIWVVTPNLFEMGLFYGFTFFGFFALKKRWARMGLAAILFLIIMDVTYWIHRVKFNHYLEVVFLDVGKGNAALVSFPDGKRMMIDGGGFPNNYFDVGRMVIAPFLWHRKIMTVDYLALSHPQTDHMNGLCFMARAFDPKEFWYNGDRVNTQGFKNLMEALRKQHVSIKTPAQLQGKMDINGAEIEVLHPAPNGERDAAPLDGKGLNNRSMVLKISYAGLSILFPGDIEKAGEQALLERAGNRIRSHILLSPHHGSRTSSSEAFLQAVAPEICIISSGEDRYGRFPHVSVLNRLEKMKCKTLCIADLGAVTLRVDPRGTALVHSFVPGESANTPDFIWNPLGAKE